MRILFITETFPYPLDSGGRVRTYHALDILGRQHEIHLHALTRRAVLAEHRHRLETYCATVSVHQQPVGRVSEIRRAVSSLIADKPYTIMRHVHAGVAEAIARASASVRPDLVYCDHLSMFEYGRRLGVPALIDAHNVEYRLYARYAALGTKWTPRGLMYARESRVLERYERLACLDANLVLAVSDVDADAIRELTGGQAHVRTVPIALDVEAVTPIARLTSSPELVFLGGLHWPANADAIAEFAAQMLPSIRQAVPDARLTVVGRDDVRAAAELRRIAGVRLSGTVENIDPYLRDSRVMIVPLRVGSGTRVKILDALTRGLPVVSTTLGCEGLAVISGRDVLMADDAGAFVRDVVRVLRDTELAMALAREGRRVAYDHHRVAAVAPKLLDAVAAAGRPRAGGEA